MSLARKLARETVHAGASDAGADTAACLAGAEYRLCLVAGDPPSGSWDRAAHIARAEGATEEDLLREMGPRPGEEK